MVSYYFKRVRRDAKLPDVRVHDLRHTAASMLLRYGTPPKIVQELLGHATVALTLAPYSHVTPTMHREAVQQFDQAFRTGNEFVG
ncbi:MAG: tyrosine-type recombinase/integrase [Chloroflexi bacterium]|nr:tyrosine-type recombinase/integrase [Chloroflexota bacterium]